MTTDSASTPLILQLISVIFMIGTIRGAILLLQDSMKHKKFAKIIRIIAGVVQLASIVGSVIIICIIYLNPQIITSLQSLTSWTFLGVVIMIIGGIAIISYVTNIRGGILLFMESKKKEGFKKRIRIICGVIMILALFLSFVTM